MTKKGTPKEVRWYSDVEYNKMYPTVATSVMAVMHDVDYRKVFSCIDGYIMLVKNVGDWEDEHMQDLNRQYKCFQYANHLGWFVKNRDNLPEGQVEIALLPWDVISLDDVLLPADEVKQKVAQFLGVASPSEYQFSEGERRTIGLCLTKVKELKDHYGTKYEYTFADCVGNVFFWRTSAVTLQEGNAYEVTGTVKEYEVIDGAKTTVLTRCKIK